jgi:hypothetical protein
MTARTRKPRTPKATPGDPTEGALRAVPEIPEATEPTDAEGSQVTDPDADEASQDEAALTAALTEPTPAELEAHADAGDPEDVPEADTLPEPAEPVLTAAVAATTAPKESGKGTGSKRGPKIPENFPEGVITPIKFRHLLIKEQLATTLTTQTVYGWLKTHKAAFPVSHFDADGKRYDEPQAGPDGTPTTRPGVRVDEARAWYIAKFRTADKATA